MGDKHKNLTQRSDVDAKIFPGMLLDVKQHFVAHLLPMVNSYQLGPFEQLFTNLECQIDGGVLLPEQANRVIKTAQGTDVVLPPPFCRILVQVDSKTHENKKKTKKIVRQCR